RSFGGDNITEAVFRLLKAQIAAQVSQLRRGRAALQPPGKAEEFPAWLDRNAELINELVPTWFNPHDLQDDAARRRRAVNQDLGIASEEIKCKPGAEQAASFTLSSNSPLGQHFNRTLAAEEMMSLQGRLKSVQVQRGQVNALVGKDVLDSVERCNHLIA